MVHGASNEDYSSETKDQNGERGGGELCMVEVCLFEPKRKKKWESKVGE